MNYHILNNKNCFVTGATGGLGSVIAHELLEHGCNLFLIGRNKVKLQRIAKELQSKHKKKVFFAVGDLNNLCDLYRIVLTAKKKFGHIDILVNCAGIFPVEGFFDFEQRSFDECFNVNVRAPILFCRAFCSEMVSRHWGRVVNIGSSSAYAGFAGTSIYCASKHALLGFSRALQAELKGNNVRVFFVSPGSIKTDMGKLVKNQDFSTFIEPSDIAKYIAFIICFDKEMIVDEPRLVRMVVQ